MAAGGIARLFEEKRARAAIGVKKLRVNKDKLFHYPSDGRCYLKFYSTLSREWQSTLRRQYPELQETQQDGKIILESTTGGGTITLYPSVKVLVEGQQLMKKFERDFPQMAQTVQPGINRTDYRARPFEYPEGLSDSQKKREKKKTLDNNKDTLFYDKRAGKRNNLIFLSTLITEWLTAMKQRYPELQESTQDDLIRLKSKEGTIRIYTNLIVVVEGKLVERFERDFPEMIQNIQLGDLTAAMGGLNLNTEKQHPAEPGGGGTLDTPPKPTQPNQPIRKRMSDE